MLQPERPRRLPQAIGCVILRLGTLWPPLPLGSLLSCSEFQRSRLPRLPQASRSSPLHLHTTCAIIQHDACSHTQLCKCDTKYHTGSLDHWTFIESGMHTLLTSIAWS